MDTAQLYKTQISLTEWFNNIGHKKTQEHRLEDNEKRERLKILNQIIGLPYDKPAQFLVTEVVERSLKFKNYLVIHGNDLCALRLIPTETELPKLRMRGLTVYKALDWMGEQKIDPTKYKADFVPHSESNEWSTIFVVNNSGIFGEIIRGDHHQLTQGFYGQERPITFEFDFKTLNLTHDDPEALKHVTKLLEYIKVNDVSKQKLLKTQLNAKFSYAYLNGYFETVESKEYGLWFIDYNRILGEDYQNAQFIDSDHKNNDPTLRGQVGSPGKVQGKVKVVAVEQINETVVTSEEILVCEMTTPDYLPLMMSAGGIVTDFGGILSHAAIVCRELGKPCITATRVATKMLRDGMMIEIDGDMGVVRII